MTPRRDRPRFTQTITTDLAGGTSLPARRTALRHGNSSLALTTVVDVTDADSVRAWITNGKPRWSSCGAASVEGRLALGESTARTEAAYTARTRGELARITADLPERLPGTVSAPPAHAHRMVSLFADVSRRGWWRAEGTVTPVALFGDVELDLRQAAVPTGEVQINAIAPIDDIEVIVPDGVSVELTGLSVFVRKRVDVHQPASPEAAPVVRVHAVTVFGSVVVRGWHSAMAGKAPAVDDARGHRQPRRFMGRAAPPSPLGRGSALQRRRRMQRVQRTVRPEPQIRGRPRHLHFRGSPVVA